MVLRSHVFNLRKAEKERSDAATDITLSFKNRLSVSDPTNLLLTADLHTPHTMPSLTAMYSSHCHSLNQAALQERLKFSPLNFLAGKL
jgi:hypothetical protein